MSLQTEYNKGICWHCETQQLRTKQPGDWTPTDIARCRDNPKNTHYVYCETCKRTWILAQ